MPSHLPERPESRSCGSIRVWSRRIFGRFLHSNIESLVGDAISKTADVALTSVREQLQAPRASYMAVRGK